MSTLKPCRWHWSQLLLLALLPAWWGWSRHWPASLSLGLWLLVNVLVLAIAERRCPFRNDWRADRADLARDASVWSLNAIADALTGAALALLAIQVSTQASGWPLAVQIISGIWLAELGSYGLHRLSHADNWLWRVHLLHHRPSKLNLANSLTAHPLNAVYDKLARLLPLLLLGFAPAAIVAITLFQLTQSLVTHANIRGSIGWLNYLIGSAQLHRLHHSTQAAEAGNFGTAVPLWDQLFGTFHLHEAPDHVGVYREQGYPGPHQLWRLLSWPWRARPHAPR